MDSNENNERFCEYERVPLFLGCKEIMGLLGLSRTTVYGLLQSEAFPTIIVGKRRLVRKENLFEWISTHEKVIDETNPFFGDRTTNAKQDETEGRLIV